MLGHFETKAKEGPSVVAIAFVLMAGVSLGQSPAASVTYSRAGLTLSWADAEDTVRGAITPAEIRIGEPMRITVDVAPIQGPRYDGPVTIGVRTPEGRDAPGKTVHRGENGYAIDFTPTAAGEHRVEITFRTTRFKMVRAPFSVPGPRHIVWLWGITFLALLVWLIRVGVRHRATMKAHS